MKTAGLYRHCLKWIVGLILAGSPCLAGCARLNSVTPTPAPVSSSDDEILVFPSGNPISPTAENRSKFIVNLLGPDYLEFSSSTRFYWVEATAGEIGLSLGERLSDFGWHAKTDWDHQNALILSTWEKDDLELSILLFDDLDSVGIDSLSENYGILVPVKGSTLLVMHMRDLSSPP